MLPKIKKKIHSFISKEDGNIAKKNLLKVGLILSFFAMSAQNVNATECTCTNTSTRTFTTNLEEGVVTVDHNNCHNNHANYVSGPRRHTCWEHCP